MEETKDYAKDDSRQTATIAYKIGKKTDTLKQNEEPEVVNPLRKSSRAKKPTEKGKAADPADDYLRKPSSKPGSPSVQSRSASTLSKSSKVPSKGRSTGAKLSKKQSKGRPQETPGFPPVDSQTNHVWPPSRDSLHIMSQPTVECILRHVPKDLLHFTDKDQLKGFLQSVPQEALNLVLESMTIKMQKKMVSEFTDEIWADLKEAVPTEMFSYLLQTFLVSSKDPKQNTTQHPPQIMPQYSLQTVTGDEEQQILYHDSEYMQQNTQEYLHRVLPSIPQDQPLEMHIESPEETQQHLRQTLQYPVQSTFQDFPQGIPQHSSQIIPENLLQQIIHYISSNYLSQDQLKNLPKDVPSNTLYLAVLPLSDDQLIKLHSELSAEWWRFLTQNVSLELSRHLSRTIHKTPQRPIQPAMNPLKRKTSQLRKSQSLPATSAPLMNLTDYDAEVMKMWSLMQERRKIEKELAYEEMRQATNNFIEDPSRGTLTFSLPFQNLTNSQFNPNPDSFQLSQPVAVNFINRAPHHYPLPTTIIPKTPSKAPKQSRTSTRSRKQPLVKD